MVYFWRPGRPPLLPWLNPRYVPVPAYNGAQAAGWAPPGSYNGVINRTTGKQAWPAERVT